MTPEDIYPIIIATRDTMLAEAEASGVPMELDRLAGLIRVVELFNADICEGTLFAARRMPRTVGAILFSRVSPLF